MRVSGQRYAPAALHPGNTRYPMYRRLDGPQGRPGRVRKIWPPTGIRSIAIPAELSWPTKHILIKGKSLPQQAEVAQGVSGRLRSRIFLTLGNMRVVGRQPYAPTAFTPGEIPGTHF